MTTQMKANPKSDQPDTKGHILVVEDEEDLQEVLRYNLAREGYDVTITGRGEEAAPLVAKKNPNLILLDLMLPGIDGLEVCRTLKSNPETRHIPVVMLTAKGEEADIVIGLEMGADDYITKPFSPRVLLARLKAVLRRPTPTPGQEDGDTQGVVRVNDIEIDAERHEVRVKDNPVDLTATEFRVLSLLATKPGRVFTRSQIIDIIHDGYAAVTDRSVDVQVVSLRRKLGEQGDVIQTVRGVGYRLRD